MPKHENLAAALAAFQAELPKLSKDQTAKVRGETNDGRPVNYSYGYAGLDQVTEQVSPALGEHGLSFSSFPTMTEKNGFALTYTLLHESGEERSGIWPLPDPIRTPPQKLGSAITYARRYAVMAVTNTFPGGEDDDGAQAVPAAGQNMGAEDISKLPRERPRQQHDEPGTPATAPKKEWSQEEITVMVDKLARVDLEKLGTAYDWMAHQGLHNRLVGDTSGTTPQYTATALVVDRLAQTAAEDKITIENLSWLREFGEARGLLKLPTFNGGSLDEALAARKAAITRAALDGNENAQAMRTAAADSWADEGTDDGSPSVAVGQGTDQ